MNFVVKISIHFPENVGSCTENVAFCTEIVFVGCARQRSGEEAGVWPQLQCTVTRADVQIVYYK